MKRWIALFLCAGWLLMLCGCAKEQKETKAAETPPQSTPRQTPAPQTEAPAPQTEAPVPQPKAEISPHEVASVSTPISDRHAGRLENIRLACAATNEYVVGPGSVFSFNDVVGERTPQRGYQDAIIFKEKEKVKEPGGGICQLSSTIYLAALQAGLPVIERHAHQLPVDYVEEGQDAAVDYGHLDLKFQNNTADPITLQTALTEDAVIVVLTANR